MPNNVMNKPYQRAELVRRWVAGEMSVSAMEKSVARKACGRGEQPPYSEAACVPWYKRKKDVESLGMSVHCSLQTRLSLEAKSDWGNP